MTHPPTSPAPSEREEPVSVEEVIAAACDEWANNGLPRGLLVGHIAAALRAAGCLRTPGTVEFVFATDEKQITPGTYEVVSHPNLPEPTDLRFEGVLYLRPRSDEREGS